METALTFDDVLLVPRYSEVVPSDVSAETFFAKNVNLKIPLISSAMDTVTEHKVAQRMAQHGGLGIIHKNLSIVDQAFEVEKVKKYESGMILDPITLGLKASVREAVELMQKYSISGVPITENKKLVGILTNRDLRFEENLDQPVTALMTSENLITTKKGTKLSEAKLILKKHRIEKLPVVDELNNLIGLITIKDIEKSENFPLATKDSFGRLMVGASIGVSADSEKRATELVKSGVDVLVIDTAHGHSKNVFDMLSLIKKKFPEVILVAGNVVSAEATEELFKRGADVVKVGVGPGSICTTRVVAGVGMPQLSAIKECSEIARKHKKTIIADGGIKYSGDIVKAIAFGAQTVMIGNLLAGTQESPGELVLFQGRSYKTYRGMGSVDAMRLGSRDRYAQEAIGDDKLVPEGIEGRVPFKGSISDVLFQLVGGLRSGMGYLGAKDISALQDNPRFVKMTAQGYRESHVHDVQITKEAPNYRLEM